MGHSKTPSLIYLLFALWSHSYCADFSDEADDGGDRHPGAAGEHAAPGDDRHAEPEGSELSAGGHALFPDDERCLQNYRGSRRHPDAKYLNKGDRFVIITREEKNNAAARDQDGRRT